jgi:hypothetical protein
MLWGKWVSACQGKWVPPYLPRYIKNQIKMIQDLNKRLTETARENTGKTLQDIGAGNDF